uniref:Anoctamin n=1 Tax=Rhabditophanes sp. KR3021 TaxID=114890 RepID=A0AC35U007_9BILA
MASIKLQDDANQKETLPLISAKDLLKPNNTYFKDGVKLVDYVLVFKSSNEVTHRVDERKSYELYLKYRGLEIEFMESQESSDTVFVLVHAPFNVLLRQAEVLKMRMPLGRNDMIGSEGYSEGIISKCIGELEFMKLSHAYTKRLNEVSHYTESFEKSRLKHYLNYDDHENFFSKSERSRIVYDLLNRTSYRSADSDKLHIGIERLLNAGSYVAAYPPHERLIKDRRVDLRLEEASDRQILYDVWASFRMWYKHQPLDLVKRYFGTKIGIYFAWLGYFTKLLIIPAFFGPLFMIYGYISSKYDIPIQDICTQNKLSHQYVCPSCDTYCDYTQLNDSCLYARLTYIVDNFGTAIFAFGMSIWATLFLEGWKRYNSKIAYKWGILNQETEHETIRPEFQFRMTQKRVNPITKELELYMPTTLKFLKKIVSGVFFLFIMALALAFILGILVYRMILMGTFHTYEKTTFLHNYGLIIIFATTAIMNLIFVLVMNLIYHRVAYKLTCWECPRTQSEFDNSYTLKVFLFEFINCYSSFFYIAFIKGRFSGVPGADVPGSIYIGGHRVENCDVTGCMAELMIQLFVIMCGSQIICSIMELVSPLLCMRFQRLKGRFATTHTLYYKNVVNPERLPQYERDFALYTVDQLFLFDEYLEMVIEFGFVTLFCGAFPMAPFFALLNNIIEIRTDARKLVSMYQKPMPGHSANIGMWETILEVLSTLAVLSNINIIPPELKDTSVCGQRGCSNRHEDTMNGGRFDFDDGGTYCGDWEQGKAHGHGVCTGPQGKGEYAGVFLSGFEVSGVYTYPSGNVYMGQWQNGRQQGLGVEFKGKWSYKGDYTQGLKGRYGQRKSLVSEANYLGTWSSGFHDGYGTETYCDGGTYQGHWLRGMRHGYGIRKSAAYGTAMKFRSRSHTNASLTSLRSDYGPDEEDGKKKEEGDEAEASRGGFVLRARSDAPQKRRRSLSERSLAVKRTILSGLRIKKQHSTGDIHQRATSTSGSLRSSGSTMSCTSVDSNGEQRNVGDKGMDLEEKVEINVIEVYRGEWKNDKRCGFGICERSDGLRYEGEWLNNKKNGYGITFFKDNTKEEGRYKNNILICSTRRKGLLFVRSAKLKERIEGSVEAGHRAASIAQQKADIAVTRAMTAQERAEKSNLAAEQAKEDAEASRIKARKFDANFKPGNAETIRSNRSHNSRHYLNSISGPNTNHVSFESNIDPPLSNQQSFDLSFEQGTSRSGQIIDRPPMLGHFSQNPSQEFTTPEEEAHYKSNFHQQHSQDSGHHPQVQYHPNHPNHPNQSTQQYYQPISYTNPGHQSYQQQYNQQTHHQLYPTIQNPHPVPQQVSTAAIAQDIQRLSTSERRPSYIDDPNLLTPTAPPQISFPNKNDEGSVTPLVEVGFTENALAPPNRGLTKSNVTSSNFSLSDDHYDQYRFAGDDDRLKLKRNRPSLTRQSDVTGDGTFFLNKGNSYAGPYDGGEGSSLINRRSTLAGTRDKKVEGIATLRAKDMDSSFDRGSLPNLTELDKSQITMHREDAARLASQRRQETQRLLEENEILRNNPLRYLTHLSFRNWLYRNRTPLFLATANLILLYILIQLLTYKTKTVNNEDKSS